MMGSSDFATIRGDTPLRVLIVGTGGMGMSWLRAVQRHADLELVGVADLDERRAKGALIRIRRPELPVASSLDGFAAVPADLCVNVTPPNAHATVIEQALGRGLAVLSEKPFAARLADAIRLTALARKQNRLLAVAQSRSYDPNLTALRDAAKRLGPLSTVTAELGVAYPAAGFRADLAHPLLLDMAVHAFDAVRRVTGARPIAGYCDAFNPPGSGYRGPAAAAAVFEMDGGVRFSYTASWCAGGLPTSWHGRWRVNGADGTAEWDGSDGPRVGYGAGDPVDLPGGVAASTDPVEQITGPLNDFVQALRTGTPPWGECADNLYTRAMVEAAIVSAAQGQRVRIDDLLADSGLS